MILRWLRKRALQKERVKAADVVAMTADMIATVLRYQGESYERGSTIAVVYCDAADRARLLGTELAENVRNGEPL